MVFHSLISARFVPPLNNTPSHSHPANGCVLPAFVGLLVNLPEEDAFSHRDVRYGGSPTIFIVSSQKPDPPFASLFVPLREDTNPLYVHLFPPIPVSPAYLDEPIEPLHLIESSTIDAIICLFVSLLRDTIVALGRTAFALPVKPTWPSYPRYHVPTFYWVVITGSLPSDNPPYHVVWGSICFINSIHKELSCSGFERTSLLESLDWLRSTRSQSRAAWVLPPNPTPPTPSNPVMVDLFRIQTLTLSDDVYSRAQESADFESSKSIPPPNSQSSSFDLIVLNITGLMQDRMGALQSYLGVLHAQRLLELENLEFSAAGGSYEDILARSLKRLTTEMPTVRADDDELFRRLLQRRDDLDSQFHVLMQSGIPILGYSTIDGASLKSAGFIPPSWVSWVYIPDDAAGLYRPCTQHLTAVLEHARVHFHDPSTARILVISTSVLRCLVPATEMGMATVIPDFPHDLEIQVLRQVFNMIPEAVAWTQRIQPLTHLLTVNPNAEKGKKIDLSLIHHAYALVDSYSCFPHDLGEASVDVAHNLLNNQRVTIKSSVNADQNVVIEREALVYRQLAGCSFLPRVMWSGPIGHLQGNCLEFLGYHHDCHTSALILKIRSLGRSRRTEPGPSRSRCRTRRSDSHLRIRL